MDTNSVKAIITGGVSGLGLEVARYFVKAGARVALFDINDKKAADVIAELREQGYRIISVCAETGREVTFLHQP